MEGMKGYIPGVALVTALVVNGVGKLVQHYRSDKREKEKHSKLIPQVHVTGGNVTSIEEFGNYVARQIGLDGETPVVKCLSKIAGDYLRGDNSRFEEGMENLFFLLNRVYPSITDDEIDDLNKSFVKELDLCILSYFSFHWDHNKKILHQVVKGGSAKNKKSLKMAVLTATRKQRFENVTKDLKGQRTFSNMLEMMKAIGKYNRETPVPGSVMVPADASVRQPVLLMLGGGMGAGKSTIAKEIMEGSFWKSVSSNAVVIEADAFKESDVVYRALNSLDCGQDASEVAEFVHKASTDSASSVLVTALNEGRDIVLDGTMAREGKVRQIIAMVRDIHNRQYRRMSCRKSENVPGEIHWEPVDDSNEAADSDDQKATSVPVRKPYRIELVGVLCDAHLAVVRGIRRAIVSKRGVPLKGQLTSHMQFAKSVEAYCALVDHAKIYSTCKLGSAGELIGYKHGPDDKLLKNHEQFVGLLEDLKNLNIDANSVFELYNNTSCHEKWLDLVISPDRLENQQRLSKRLNDPLLQHEFKSEWDSSETASSLTKNHLEGSGSSPVHSELEKILQKGTLNSESDNSTVAR